MLSAVERKIEQFITDLNDKEVSGLYAQLPNGKRLRAKLILKIAGSSLSVVKTAAVVEMIHAASLLHDDVIDHSDKRRGRPSANKIWGITPVNEPEGNNGAWESMHFSPEEEAEFIAEHLGPAIDEPLIFGPTNTVCLRNGKCV